MPPHHQAKIATHIIRIP